MRDPSRNDYQGMSAVIYCRVSTPGQEKEGFSLPGQQRTLREYASKQGFKVIGEFVEAESASVVGRRKFGEMIDLIERQIGCVHVLVIETDRLIRHQHDGGTIKDLIDLDKIEVHFVSENKILNVNSPLSDFLAHDFSVIFASNNKRVNKKKVKAGVAEKAKAGYWPFKTKYSYLLAIDSTGKKTMKLDGAVAPFLLQLGEEFANGNYSLKTIAKKYRNSELANKKSGKPLTAAQIHRILRDKSYAGVYSHAGVEYQGKYEPLFSMELWNRIQRVLDQRNKAKIKEANLKEFSYKPLMSCGCGLSITAEVQKGHKYYHCTQFRGNHKAPFIREEVLDKAVKEILEGIRWPEEVVALMGEAHAQRLTASGDIRHQSKEWMLRRIKVLDKSLGMLLDKLLVGTIEDDLYRQKEGELKLEKMELAQGLQNWESFNRGDVLGQIPLPRLLALIPFIYSRQTPTNKRHFLKLLLHKATLNKNDLQFEFKAPFDLLIGPTVNVALKKVS